MVIDGHVHIFPAAVRRQREAWFAGEPAFEALYRSPKSRLVGAGELIAAMDQAGVDQAVVFGFPWQSADAFKAHNDYVLEAVARYPRRLIGLACFDAAHPAAAREAERCLAAGLAGVGELAFYRGGIDQTALAQLAPVMALCADAGRPVLIHTNEPVGHPYPGKTPVTLAQIEALLKRFPENRIVLAHWGGGIFFYRLMKKEMPETFRNAFFDTAASPYLYRPEIYRMAVELLGADRILFGSDFPLLPAGRYLAEIHAAGLKPEQIEAICGGNARRLFAPAP